MGESNWRQDFGIGRAVVSLVAGSGAVSCVAAELEIRAWVLGCLGVFISMAFLNLEFMVCESAEVWSDLVGWKLKYSLPEY